MKTRRTFTFLVILVLCLSTFNAAQAISPDAVLDLFDVRANRNEQRWIIDKLDRKAEGTVNGHDYIMYVNAINGKVTEIVFRGWFDDFVRVPRSNGMGDTWGPGNVSYLAFTTTLHDLGIFEDALFPDGGPFGCEEPIGNIQRGDIANLKWVKEYWNNLSIRKGLFEATNIATGTYVLLRGWEHGEFEAYFRLP